MDRDSVERLRYDRRLQRRRGWLAEGEQEKYLESLPDVSSKMQRIGDDEQQEGTPATSGSPSSTTSGSSGGASGGAPS